VRSSARSESFTDSLAHPIKPVGVYAIAVAYALSASSAVLALGSLFAFFDSGADLVPLAVAAIICGVVGGITLRRPFAKQSLRPVPTMSAAITAFLTVAALSTLLYVVTRTLTRVDDALYESVAGVSTNALSIFEDPSVISDGMLIWRAGTQWLGGLAALGLAVGLLPFLGGSRELSGGPQLRARGNDALATRPVKALKRVAAIYAIVTSGVAIAFLVAGMGPRDAVAHSLSTVSTGGFSTWADSIGHFDSWAVEFVAIGAMVGAASSVAIAWLFWRRAFGDTRRAFELQVYLAGISGATLWVWWLQQGHDGTDETGIREALFTVVSVATTTGHRVADWGSWHPGASALLLVMLVIGGTAGSVAGGLRWIRLIGMGQFIWRELQRQLHPRLVRTVKVGRTKISEASVDRMHAQMVYVMTLGAVASLVLALFGEGITEAITLTISAISTMGPGFDDSQQGIVSATQLSRPERAVLMPVMLTGRVFLYPAFVAGGAALTEVARRARAVSRR